MSNPEIMKARWFPLLACPACKQSLIYREKSLFCEKCSATYAIHNGVPILMDPESLTEYQTVLTSNFGREMVDQYVAESPWAKFINAIKQIVTVDYVPYPPDLKAYIQHLGPEAQVLEVGSGSRRIYPDMINLDIGLFPNVDVVGDGAKLPFQNHCLDFIIIDVVLEHVKYPEQFIQEAHRTLKKGGLLYVALPFIHPYHGYPADYHRFSVDSLKLLTEGFTISETGVLRGPMVAMLNCLSELPFLFSFSNNPRFYQVSKGIALLFTFWLKYLDKILVKNPQSHRLAHCLFFLGKKDQ